MGNLHKQLADMIAAGVSDGLLPNDIAGNVLLTIDLAAKPADEGTIRVLAIAPEKCGCGLCDDRLHLNRVGYVCDKHTSVEFNVGDCEAPPSTTGEPKR